MALRPLDPGPLDSDLAFGDVGLLDSDLGPLELGHLDLELESLDLGLLLDLDIGLLDLNP